MDSSHWVKPKKTLYTGGGSNITFNHFEGGQAWVGGGGSSPYLLNVSYFTQLRFQVKKNLRQKERISIFKLKC